MSFKNKVALVTGSGSGIGEATAIRFAKEGADIVIVERNEETATKTAEKCKEFGYRVLVVKTDISKDDEAKNAVEKTIEEFGRLDVLINNAGIVRKASLLDGPFMRAYDETMDTNLRAVFHMTYLAVPYLDKTKGSIINISSISSKTKRFGCCYNAYMVSKAGIDCFTHTCALELAKVGVRVNAVSPGPVYTNVMINSGIDDDVAAYAEATAMRRVSDPEEIAELIWYLASDKAKGITGSNFTIDNGMNLM